MDRAGHQTHLQEDVDDASISENVDDPEEEIGDPNKVVDQWMLRRELSPVLVSDLQYFAIDPIKQRCRCGIDKVVMLVHIDPTPRGP